MKSFVTGSCPSSNILVVSQGTPKIVPEESSNPFESKLFQIEWIETKTNTRGLLNKKNPDKKTVVKSGNSCKQNFTIEFTIKKTGWKTPRDLCNRPHTGVW